ncbi:MAG: glycine zipper 2TM domain-containing protein [Rhizobiales bacterium]|nr:glycine zipper 2TM domain-containing protein [Hyphomicrobiales bacterium]
MKKTILAAAALASALALAGCNTPGERAAGGAAIGAVSGALIGNAIGGNTGSTLAGAAIGGTAGAIIGSQSAPRRSCARYGYDYYGNYVCTRYYAY